MFKTLKLYLEFEKLTNLRLINMYKHLLINDCNLFEIDPSINQKKIKEESLQDIDEIPNGEILTAINNQINCFVNKFKQSSIPDIMESVHQYFLKEDIIAIINNNIEQ